MSWLVVLALICSAFAITAQESDEGAQNLPELGAPDVSDPADGAAPQPAPFGADLPTPRPPAGLVPVAGPDVEGAPGEPEGGEAANNNGGLRLPPPRLPAGHLAPPAADFLPEPAREDVPGEQDSNKGQVGGLNDDAISASDRPLTNLDTPISNESPEEQLHGSAHQPHYPAQPHSYALPRRDEQAREAIQRRAEFKAAQRARRIETMKWFGYSNSRPTASSVPFMGTYSPTWVGNGSLPSHWSGVNGWSTSVRVEARTR